MRHLALFSVASVLVLSLLGVHAVYRQEMGRLRTGLADRSSLIETRHGRMEVALQGEGPPVLLLHGAGGGYDQSLLLGRMFLGPGHLQIAVSRFGYLRSNLPSDASTMAQAEALLDVLNSLGIDRVAVLAMSGGVPPALQLASLAPGRITGLVLLSSAPFTPLTQASQDLPVPVWAYRMLFSTDFPIWAVLRLAPGALDPVFDITAALRQQLTSAEAAAVNALVLGFLPVTDRQPGMDNEGAAIDPDARYDFARITTPTLIAHARDDGINPFPIGEFLARNIPHARFLALPRGGHLLMGHWAEVAKAAAPLLDPGSQ